jgi:hypothetical protein
VCGLAYGFNPYRVAHLEHLELLLAFGMPAALAALHRYAETGRARWLAALAIALTIQALSTSYYALFFTVLVAGWLIWFMRPRAWRKVLAILAAGAVSVLAVSPLFVGYIRIHRSLSLTREFSEILQFSGDLSSLVTASPLSAAVTDTEQAGPRSLDDHGDDLLGPVGIVRGGRGGLARGGPLAARMGLADRVGHRHLQADLAGGRVRDSGDRVRPLDA